MEENKLVAIGGWYTISGPLVDTAGQEIKNLIPSELVEARGTSVEGNIWVQGLESREYAWITASSLTRAQNAPGEWR